MTNLVIDPAFGHAMVSFAAYLLGKWVGRKQAIRDRTTRTCLHANQMCSECSKEWGLR